MPITFRCQSCHKEVTAPDSAAGKTGKCPYCGQANLVPAGADEDNEIPLAPIDEAEEVARQEQIRALYEQEQDLLSEIGGPPPIPLDQLKDIQSSDLHHFVVNYCLDMADGKLQRAEQHVEQLQRYGMVGYQAVEDFLSGMATEPAMDHIPRPVLLGFLRELKAQIR